MSSTLSRRGFDARKGFRLTLGAWDPAGDPPDGMPADAINLATVADNITYVDSEDVTADGALFEIAWVEQTGDEQFGVIVPGDVTFNVAVGSPDDPSIAIPSDWIGNYVASGEYANPVHVGIIRVSVGVTSGTLADLTMGKAIIHVGVGRWPSNIRRSS